MRLTTLLPSDKEQSPKKRLYQAQETNLHFIDAVEPDALSPNLERITVDDRRTTDDGGVGSVVRRGRSIGTGRFSMGSVVVQLACCKTSHKQQKRPMHYRLAELPSRLASRARLVVCPLL